MDYKPTNAVWEITYACNMRCKHCGSSCGEKYPDELSTEEALTLCDDLANLGLRIITLSGGEPFMRGDWPLIAQRLTQRGVTTNVISNGWFISEELIHKAKKAGIVNIGISLDGLKETHDFIRRKGSFDRVMSGLDAMMKIKIPAAINTSINKRNLYELEKLKEILINKKVMKWQFQIASPMGNLLDHPGLIISPEEVDVIIDTTYAIMKEGRILPYLADDIGYYNRKEMEIRSQDSPKDNTLCSWGGCHAGKRVLGIRANGDISGCLSIRDDDYLEGNIRKVPLKELWSRPQGFVWNRKFDIEKLRGFCKTCQYAARCLGGCSGAKLTLSKSLYENKYCSYRNTVAREAEKIKKKDNYDELVKCARAFLNEREYQIAEIYLQKALAQKPGNQHCIDLLSFVYYSLGNYTASIEYTKKSLQCNPRHFYAYKIRGLCYAKSGKADKGISDLHKALKYASSNDYSDIYLNLAAILDDNGMTKDAIRILDQVRKVSEKFKAESERLYQSFKGKLLTKKTNLSSYSPSSR